MSQKFDWDKFEDAGVDNEFDWDNFEDDDDANKTSKIESQARGLVQGIPFVGTWADEATGLVESALTDKTYRQAADESLANYEKAADDNPVSYYGAMMVPTLAMAPIKGVPVLGTALSGAMGAMEGAGASKERDMAGIGKDALLSGGLSAATAGIGNKLMKAKALVPKKRITSLAKLTDKVAQNATGATPTQTLKFKPGSAGQLVERGIIGFGDTAENIYKKSRAAMDEANRSIDEALKALDARGITASADNVVAAIQGQISALRENASKSSVVRQLESIVDDIMETGKSNISMQLGEQTKRGFNKQANNWMDPEKGEAGKAAYRAYKNEVEGAAIKADPTLAEKFMAGKKDYGMLAPIEEATERAAARQNQWQPGGLYDMLGGITGATAYGGFSDSDDPATGALSAIAGAGIRRFAGPRASSSIAVGMHNLEKIVRTAPQKLGKFANTLTQAAQRGGNSLAATHYVLQQKDPEYQEMLQNQKEDGE